MLEKRKNAKQLEKEADLKLREKKARRALNENISTLEQKLQEMLKEGVKARENGNPTLLKNIYKMILLLQNKILNLKTYQINTEMSLILKDCSDIVMESFIMIAEIAKQNIGKFPTKNLYKAQQLIQQYTSELETNNDKLTNIMEDVAPIQDITPEERAKVEKLIDEAYIANNTDPLSSIRDSINAIKDSNKN